VLGGLRVLDTSGHTPGHISFFAPAAGILFCGDSLVSGEDGIHGSRPGLTWNDAQAALPRKSSRAWARIVCSGHGPVVMDAAGKFPALDHHQMEELRISSACLLTQPAT